MGISRCLAVVVGALGLVANAIPTVSAQEQAKPLVLIERVVDANYGFDAVDYGALLRSNLTKPYIVKPGDSLPSIVNNRFAIGQTKTPELYAHMADRIGELNDLPNPRALPAGLKLELPDIPPLLKASVASVPEVGVPRAQAGPSFEMVQAGNETKFWERVYKQPGFNLSATGLKTEPLVSQLRWTSPEVATAELNSAGGAKKVIVWDQPLIVSMADGGIQLGASILPDDAKFIGTLLKRKPPPNEVVLYVLDDSWPDAEAFSGSKEFLIAAMDAVRKRYRLGAGLPNGQLNGITATDFRLGKQAHSAAIKASLGDFHALTKKVRVIYLPLFVEQAGSRDLWMELAFLVACANRMSTQLGKQVPNEAVRAEALEFATEIIGRVPKKAVDAVGPAQQGPISLLQKFAQLYAQTTGVPFFINMSWTIKARQVDFGPDPDALGVSLAATGNDALDVMDDAVYLAYRAKAFPGDVLAVMNTDGEGIPICRSGKLPLTGKLPFYGLAYDGRVEKTGDCGTSFSTPRVAWLLALRQTYDAPLKENEWRDWYGAYRLKILALQGSAQVTSKRYWLPVAKLFEGL